MKATGPRLCSVLTRGRGAGQEDSRAAIAVDRQRAAFIACDLLKQAGTERFRRLALRPRRSQNASVMAQTDWHAFRRRWRRDGARALGAVPPPLAAPLRCVALAAPFCEFADAARVARCSRAARCGAPNRRRGPPRRQPRRRAAGAGRRAAAAAPAAPFPEGFRTRASSSCRDNACLRGRRARRPRRGARRVARREAVLGPRHAGEHTPSKATLEGRHRRDCARAGVAGENIEVASSTFHRRRALEGAGSGPSSRRAGRRTYYPSSSTRATRAWRPGGRRSTRRTAAASRAS